MSLRAERSNLNKIPRFARNRLRNLLIISPFYKGGLRGIKTPSALTGEGGGEGVIARSRSNPIFKTSCAPVIC